MSTLYPFQVEGVRAIRDFDGRCLLADAVGLGKTVMSLTYAHKYVPAAEKGPIIIVVPAHLRINWEREAQKHFKMRVQLVDSQRVPSHWHETWERDQAFVISYNCLVPPNWSGRSRLPDDSWAAYFLKHKPRLLIADEGHYLKSDTSDRHKAFRHMARHIKRVLILTGTPLTNSPVDLYALLNILRPDLYRSKWDFCMEYTHARKEWYGWVFKGAKNLDVLHNQLVSEVMIRRRKEDVIKDLPLIRHEVIDVEVDLTEYNRIESDFVTWIDEEQSQLAANVRSATELVKLNFMKQYVGQLKMEWLERWCRDYFESSESKLLIGSVHHAFSDQLAKRLKKLVPNLVQVDGRHNSKVKQRGFDEFNGNPETRVLIGNLEAAGTGWSCTATSEAIVGELPWVPAQVEQFAGRIHGIGRGVQGRGVHVRYPIVRGTIEEDLAQVLQRKKAWSVAAVDGSTDLQAFDIYEQVKEAIRTRRGGKS